MKKKFQRYLAFFMALNIIFEVVSPTVSMALTNGPLQPEFTGFEPANSSEMVDLFTGDFKYNIPLMDVEGYPLNLSYHAGATMETEASWVGLGWSMNPGVLNRAVKGLPDDFNGDIMKSETRIKPHVSMGVGYQQSAWFGFQVDFSNIGAGPQIGVDAAIVLTYNNYKGFGVELQLDGNASLSGHAGPASGFVSGGVGMTLSSQDGGTLSYQHAKGFGLMGFSASVGEGTSINTRTGAMTKTYFGSVGVSAGGVSLGFSTSHTLPSGSVSYSPRIANDYKNNGFGLSAKFGLWGCVQVPIPPLSIQLKGGYLIGFKGFYNKSELAANTKNSNAYGFLYLENADDNALMDFNRFKDGAISEEVPNGPLANKTYDNFSAVAQGMASNFRPFRSDVGIVHDTYNTNKGNNTPVSTELSAALILHSLYSALTVINNGYSGNWNTLLNNNIKFQDKDITLAANRFYEKVYFKQFGELVARNGAFDNALGNENPISPVLIPAANGYEAVTAGGLTGAARTIRDIRSTNIGFLTATQANQYGFEKTLNFYDNTPATHNVNQATRMVNKSSTASNLNVSRLTKSVPGNSGYPVGHHLSEICMTNSGGSRYIYGIPAYNLYKKRVMFNASDRTESAYQANGFPGTNYTPNALKKSNTHQLVEYNPANDLSNNKRGAENLYQADETPAFASSFLLTNILSTDYVDVTQDGPSYDDLGSFTKFNYSKVSNFEWREPYGAPTWATIDINGTRGNLPGVVTNQANFDKGLVADALDDKAFYEYGVRENYYPQSIETKNYVAFFETSLRSDFTGVAGEHGAASAASTYKLDNIKLYSKSEIIAKGSVALAVPIKTVFFEYNYELCPNTFNSNAATHGKLTLKKVYFTYGNSQKAALSPYQFYYGDNDHDLSGNVDTYGNPDYNNKATDRWGYYKPNSTNSGVLNDETPDVGSLNKLNNIEFPYAEQNETLANQYAVAWNLTKIVTPTSAVIEVTYEADDYGYIQNEQAGQMLMISNSKDFINPTTDNASAYAANNNLFDANYLIVDLSKLNTGIPTSLSLATANNLAQKSLFRLNSDVYYKCFMKLGGPANSFGLRSTFYDYVPGYATVDDVGLFSAGVSGNTYTQNSNTYYKYAYVRLKKEIAYASKEVNPISLAAWEYMRSFLPRVAYPGSEPANMGDGSHKPVKQFANALLGLGVALSDFITGVSGNPNFRFHFRNFCKEMDYSKSFVRAFVPYKRKKGGGYRIKQLLTKDVWNQMTTNTSTGNSESSAIYGQNFDYTTLDVDKKTIISSGVAYYEPLLGGDEISLRRPIKFTLEKKMAPNDHLFQEEPFGEMLFPSPLVGYSKVTVTPIADPTLTSLYKIGKSVFEFYTAKDYPIIESRTALNKQLYQNDLVENFMVVTKAYKIMHATQGHVLKFNDMHGKLKAINTYGEDNLNSPISGARYTYKDAPCENGIANYLKQPNSRQLVTKARTISEKNVITTEQIARDIDVTVDNRSNLNEATTLGASLVIELSLCKIPFNISTDVQYAYQQFGLQSSITTKIVQQYGILEKSEVFDNKSRTLTENLLWDRNTGDVVLSKATNHLDQPVYSFNCPAYWAYPKMGSEFKREGLIIKVAAGSVWNRTTGALAKATLISPIELLSVGDEVVVYEAGSPIINSKRYWVTYDYSSTSYNFALVDESGIILNSSTAALSLANDHYIKIIRAADRNQLSENMSKTSALTIQAFSVPTFSVDRNIISEEAQSWCSGWNAYMKDDASTTQQNNCLFNTYNNVPATGNQRFNPYTAGVLGNWRPVSSFHFDQVRDYNYAAPAQPNMKADGITSSMPGYFFYGGSGTPIWLVAEYQSPNSHWTPRSTNTVYSPNGYLMENMDAIGVYHAQRYGFNHSLPILSAANAQVRQVGFDSFEDYLQNYGAINSCNIIGNDQLGFYNQISFSNSTKPLLTTSTAHTGRTSLSFLNSQNVTLTHYINKSASTYPYLYLDLGNSYSPAFCSQDVALNKLNFTAGKYVASFWVKGSIPSVNYASGFSFNVEAQNGSGTPVSITGIIKQSNIINGWQKFDYEFTVPASYTANSTIRFKWNATTNMYLDDFRVQPFNSSMTCTVYDPYQLRVWAHLDDDNYATIMEYDDEGMLVRKKKETLKGIYTVQETRQSTVKRN